MTANFWSEVEKGAPIIICEAPIDALSIAVCGFPALALCGKEGWPAWLPIRCAFKNVDVALDADDAGDQSSQKLSQVLASLAAKTFRLRPEGAKDWNEILHTSGQSALADWLAAELL